MKTALFLALASTVFAADDGPRLGKYNCLAFGAVGNPPILITSFELRPGGEYVEHNKPGKYSYDAATKTVTWLSGINKDSQYGGKFEVQNNTHTVRMTRGAVCSNTLP